MKTSWPTMVILMTLTVAAAPGLTHAQDHRSSPVTSREVAGTLLVLRPHFAYQQAVLRVVGPGGYEARQSFEVGSIVALDLLAAGRMPTRETLGREGKIDAPRSLLILPDGHYRYEAVFAGVSGPVIARGHLFVRNGSLHTVPQPEEGTTGSTKDADLVPTEAALTGAEELVLTDDNNNGLTRVELQANTTGGTRLENWQIANSQGDFHIIEDGTGSQNEVSLAILQDVAGGVRVGLGTSAPATDLHLVSSNSFARFRLEPLSGGSGAWDLKVSNIFGAASGSGFSISEPFGVVGARPFIILKGALSTSMVLTPQGVAIGNNHAQAQLHVWGDAIITGDVRLGSSRSLKHELEAVPLAATLNDVLALPLYRWKYKNDDLQATHVGPMAEDFYARFGVGRDDKHLSPADSAGLALAAIQGLHGRFEKQVGDLLDADRRLATENARLLERLEAIEQTLLEAER